MLLGIMMTHLLSKVKVIGSVTRFASPGMDFFCGVYYRSNLLMAVVWVGLLFL